MKIVRLVLLLSLVGLPAACSGAAITEPEKTVPVYTTPHFDAATPPDTTKARDSGGVFGSGT